MAKVKKVKILKVKFKLVDESQKSLIDDFLCDCIERITLSTKVHLISKEYFDEAIKHYADLEYTIIDTITQSKKV